MVAMTAKGWIPQFAKLQGGFRGALDATKGLTARRRGMTRRNVQLTATFWGFDAAQWTTDR